MTLTLVAGFMSTYVVYLLVLTSGTCSSPLPVNTDMVLDRRRDTDSLSTSHDYSLTSQDHNFHRHPYQEINSTVRPLQRLPSAIIIGVKKAGTRALLEFLKLHPDVRATGPEPHFFDRNWDKGLDWYRRQMPSTLPGQLTIEKTPSYFVTKEVPGRLRRALGGDVKLLLVVRDPVTRAISDYTQTMSKRPRVKSFEALALSDNQTGLVDSEWQALKIGVYSRYLARWLRHFPLTNIHLVSGERLISSPAEVLQETETFLGLRPVISQKHFFFNSTKGFPCLKKKEGSARPHCLGRTKGREHPKVDLQVLQRLRDFFRPFNNKFYQMTGIDFGWP